MRKKYSAEEGNERKKRPKELKRDPRVLWADRQEKERDARRQALEHDKVFVTEKALLERKLNKVLSSHRKEVEQFLERFALPSAFDTSTVRKALNAFHDMSLRRVLVDYIEFSNRFRVSFRVKGNPPTLNLAVAGTRGKKFHVRVVKDHLEPARTPNQEGHWTSLKLKIFRCNQNFKSL